jgi:RNA polymerase sigma-70 factor (ECF subfamily)
MRAMKILPTRRPKSDGHALLRPSGFPQDFRTFYDLWFENVGRWIRALGGAEADRDDIAQEVFLVVRRRLHAFDGVNPAGWLYRIARRQVRDFRRRAWVKHIFTSRKVADLDALQHGGTSPAAAVERKEDQRILFAILDKISEERRTTFMLFELDGLSGEEIARIQNVPINTVWTRLYHARKDFLALATKFRQAQLRASGNANKGGTA